MQESSFFRFCISACIFLLLISLSMNFVVALNIFNTKGGGTSALPSPIVNQTTSNVSKIAGGNFISIILDNFSLLLLAEGIVAGSIGIALIIIASRTGSWNVVAAYLFGAVFWITWGNNVLYIQTLTGTFVKDVSILTALFLLITVPVAFIFTGAVLGLLGGTE